MSAQMQTLSWVALETHEVPTGLPERLRLAAAVMTVDGERCAACEQPVGALLAGDADERIEWRTTVVVDNEQRTWLLCEDCGCALDPAVPEPAPATDETFSVGQPGHLTADEAYAQVAERWGREELDDACAVTIASWWASPTEGNGLAMAELSTAGRVHVKRLGDDIFKARRESTDARDDNALDMLATWMLTHPARTR